MRQIITDMASFFKPGALLFQHFLKSTAPCLPLTREVENRLKAQRSGFETERKKEGADMQFPRLLRKPGKWNEASFTHPQKPSQSPAQRV